MAAATADGQGGVRRMSIVRGISAHRPVAVLVVLVAGCVLSLITGVEATLLHQAVNRVVSITAYPFLKAKYGLEDSVTAAVDIVIGYAALREENQALRQRVVEHQTALAGSSEIRRENARLRRLLQFEEANPRFTLEPVHVIESLQGMLTIDRGRIHGIERSMSAVAEQGVVGIVAEVYDLTAKVATLQHWECKVGAMVLRNRLRAYDGVVHAGGDAGGWCTMYYIDMKEEVQQGDVVVTSPESLFPAGYPIGTISAPPHSMGSLWKWAEVTPAVDPYRLDEIFIVRRSVLSPEELASAPQEEAVEKAGAADAPAGNAPPLQERYAP